MIDRIQFSILLLIGVLVVALPGQAQKLTISVMDVNVTSGLAANEIVMLTDKLLNELVNAGTFKVVERSKRDEILKELGFQQSGACDQGACLVEAGQLLGVQKMIGGTIGKLGAVYAVELRVMDVKTGSIDKAFSRQYTGDASNLLEAMKAAAIVFSEDKAENIAAMNFRQNTGQGLVYLSTNSQGYKEYLNQKDSSILIEIPATNFIMGNNSGNADERPRHTVALDIYYIGKYEVTVEQFKKFCMTTGRVVRQLPDWIQSKNDPIVGISSEDANDYCVWAGLRLPSEAEWENAARGGDGRIYPWGDQWSPLKCNGKGEKDGYDKTAPVGSFPNGVSPYGVFDLAGNVEEWCNDLYDEYYYARSPRANPAGPETSSRRKYPSRVVKGGGWYRSNDYCRSASRADYFYKDYRSFIGFRVAK